MSNRILSFLILIAIIGFLAFYYFYYYLPNREIPIENIGEEKPITLVEVDNPNKEAEEISLEEDNAIIDTEDALTEADINERINELRQSLNIYKSIKIGENRFEFDRVDNGLILYCNDVIVSNLDLVPENTIIVSGIYGTDNEYYIEVGMLKYLYNSLINKLSLLDLNVAVNYIKKDKQDYLINTPKGTFSYNGGTLEFVDIFEDFIYVDNGYIGIIKNIDTRRLKNYGLDGEEDNIIIHYNPTTKEKRVLYRTQLNLTKIYRLASDILFEENNNKTYRLENFI